MIGLKRKNRLDWGGFFMHVIQQNTTLPQVLCSLRRAALGSAY